MLQTTRTVLVKIAVAEGVDTVEEVTSATTALLTAIGVQPTANATLSELLQQVSEIQTATSEEAQALRTTVQQVLTDAGVNGTFAVTGGWP